MNDERDEHPGKDGLPGQQEDNHEELEPAEPTKHPAGKSDGGDDDAGGESGEGSQSTGDPNSAG